MQQGCTFKPVLVHCLRVKITINILCFVTFDMQGVNIELAVATTNK